MGVWPRLAACALLAASARPVSAKGAPREAAPPRVGLPAVQPALLDCRSPVVAHETRVAFGTPMKVGETTLAFKAGDRGAVVVTVTAPGAAPGSAPGVQILSRTPALLTVEAFSHPYALSVRLAADSGGVSVGSAFGIAIHLGAETAYLVDSDRDGALGSAGDGVVAPGCRTVAPWCSEVWTRTAAVSVKLDATSGEWRAEPLPMPHPSDGDHSAGWRLLQWRRQQAGLLPVAYDASLEAGLLAHLAYLARNAVSTHVEDPAKPGYSEAGAAAGIQTTLAPGSPNCVAGVDMLMGTLFHRCDCLEAGMSRTAMALRSGYFGLMVRILDGPLREAVYVYPPHGMSDVARSFGAGGEIPMPSGVSIETSLGTCVAAASEAWGGTALDTAPVLVVVPGARKGAAPVDGTLHYPGHPGGSTIGADYAGIVALVPGSALPAATTFFCRVRVPWPGAALAVAAGEPSEFSYEWEFATGH